MSEEVAVERVVFMAAPDSMDNGQLIIDNEGTAGRPRGPDSVVGRRILEMLQGEDGNVRARA